MGAVAKQTHIPTFSKGEGMICTMYGLPPWGKVARAAHSE